MKDHIKQCWYTPGLNRYLSSLGYTHFMTKGAITTDYLSGCPFYYDTERKEFGKCDMINSSRLDEAIILRKEFKAIIAETK